jgi:hypothetical protein
MVLTIAKEGSAVVDLIAKEGSEVEELLGRLSMAKSQTTEEKYLHTGS